MHLSLRRSALCCVLVSSAAFGCNAILGNKPPSELESDGPGGEGGTDPNPSVGGRATTGGSGGESPGAGGKSAGSGGKSGGSGGTASNPSGGRGGEPPPDGCYDDDDDSETECVPWTQCRPGSFVERAGTDSSDRRCGTCEPGSSSNDYNAEACAPCAGGTFAAEPGSAECQSWSSCDWTRVETKAGTITTDVVCGTGSDARDFDTAGADTSAGVAVDAEENVFWLINTDADLDNPDVFDSNCGTTNSCPDSSILVLKYDASGVLLWTRALDTAENDVGEAIAVDSNGYAYVTGSTLGAFHGTNQGDMDAFVTKIAPDGSIVWSRQFGTSGADYGRAITLDGDEVIYVAGDTAGVLDDDGVTEGSIDMFVRQFDEEGEAAWTQQFGGESGETASSISVDGEGLVYLAGTTYSEYLYSQQRKPDSASEVAVVVFNPADDPIAPVAYLITFGNRNYNTANQLVPADDGSFYVSATSSFSASTTGYLGRFAATGASLWAEPILVTGPSSGRVTDVAVDPAGNLTFFGQVDRMQEGFAGSGGQRNSLLLSKATPAGAVLWERVYGSEDPGNSTMYMDSPAGLAVGPSGRAYVAINTDGLFAANGAATAGAASLKMIDIAAIDAAE